MKSLNVFMNNRTSEISIDALLRHVNSGEVAIPLFQRSTVWSQKDCDEFISAVIDQGEVEMPMAFYTIQGENNAWVADGRQRIFALRQASKDPKMREAFTRFMVTAKTHHQLKSHEEAHSLFMRLNKGLSLTHYDRFKGDFVGFDEDAACRDRADFYKDLYKAVSACLPPLKQAERDKRPTSTTSVCRRDSLVLWARFKGLKAELDPSTKNPKVERCVREIYDNEKDPRDLARFKDEISKAYEAANTIFLKALTEADSKHDILEQKFTSVVVGGYLAGNESRREWVGTLESIARFVKSKRLPERMMEKLKPSEDVRYPSSNKPMQLKSGSIKAWARLGVHFPPFSMKRGRVKIPASRGRHNGHIKPFSTDGEGEVVSEPAILNQVNGAKPMAEAEAEAYRARVDQDQGAA